MSNVKLFLIEGSSKTAITLAEWDAIKPVILGGSDLSKRRDTRSNEQMLDNIKKGIAGQSRMNHIMFRALTAYGKPTEMVVTGPNSKDGRPDIAINCDGNRMFMEVEFVAGFYNWATKDRQPPAVASLEEKKGLHLKDHKYKELKALCEEYPRSGVYYQACVGGTDYLLGMRNIGELVEIDRYQKGGDNVERFIPESKFTTLLRDSLHKWFIKRD